MGSFYPYEYKKKWIRFLGQFKDHCIFYVVIFVHSNAGRNEIQAFKYSIALKRQFYVSIWLKRRKRKKTKL